MAKDKRMAGHGDILNIQKSCLLACVCQRQIRKQVLIQTRGGWIEQADEKGHDFTVNGSRSDLDVPSNKYIQPYALMPECNICNTNTPEKLKGRSP